MRTFDIVSAGLQTATLFAIVAIAWIVLFRRTDSFEWTPPGKRTPGERK